MDSKSTQTAPYAGRVIEHQANNNAMVGAPTMGSPVFGKRTNGGKKAHLSAQSGAKMPSAVSDDFFSHTTANDFEDQGHNTSAGRLLGAVVMAFMLAVIVPAVTIQMVGKRQHTNYNIDPVVTASTTPTPLEVHDVSMTRLVKSGNNVVTVLGRLTNTSSDIAYPGTVRISLVNEAGEIVQQWHHRTNVRSLQPNETLRFQSSAIDVTGQARNANVLANNLTGG